jgi:hypothetical protein
MRVDEAESVFRTMITEAGLAHEVEDPLVVWEVFKAFLAVRVDVAEADPEHDMMISEWQISEWEGTEGPQLAWSLRRQFELHDERGEYDHMEHLHCLITVAAPTTSNDELISGSGLFWQTAQLDAFVKDVESSAVFAAVRAARPARLWLEQEAI